MNALRVHLFGPLELRQGTDLLGPFPTRRAKGLFAYLVLHPGRAHSRERLAGAFWGGKDDVSARRSLRTALWRVRRIVEHDGVPAGTHLKTRDHTVEFSGGLGFWLDVREFEDLLVRAKAMGAGGSSLEAVRLLEEAVALHRGNLLEEFYEDWCLLQQQRIRLLLIGALDSLKEHCAARRAWPEALVWSQRLLELSPLREHVHRDLMRFYSLTGDRVAALQQFDRLAVLLQNELRVAPLPETVALNEALRAGQYPIEGPVSSPMSV